MDREQLIAIISRAWNSRHNSLASYILSAEPYVPPGKEAKLQAVGRVAELDEVVALSLATALAELNAPPHANPHEAFVSELNYLNIEYLTGILKEKLNEELTRLQAERRLVGEYAPLDGAIAVTKEQLSIL